MKLIDLSHTFSETMPVYPGDTPPQFTQVADYKKEGYFGYRLNSGFHVGTHIDAPFHILPGGKRLSEINIEKFFGKGILLDARGKENIDIDLLHEKNIDKNCIVLIMTGWSKKFGQENYYKNRPELTESFAKKIVELGIKIIGMDTPSPDSHPYDIHKILLRGEVLIIENLTNLESLIGRGDFEIIALPAKFYADGAPIRVVARVV